MKKRVMLSICGRQAYADQDPDVIELTTEGTMELRDCGWDVSKAESDLAGVSGEVTTMRDAPEKVILGQAEFPDGVFSGANP